jgi:tetratricopeptide (TPR) repeat protein
MGNALYMQDKFEESVQSYMKALEINPDYVEAHFNIASAYNDMADDESAIRHF